MLALFSGAITKLSIGTGLHTTTSTLIQRKTTGCEEIDISPMLRRNIYKLRLINTTEDNNWGYYENKFIGESDVNAVDL